MNERRVLKLALIVVMLLLALTLCSCGSEEEKPDVTDEVTSGTTIDAGALTVADADGAKFKIVLPFRATNSEISYGKKIASTISEKYGVTLEVIDDYNEDDPWNENRITNDEYEILIGNTNRVECSDIPELIDFESDWLVRVSGKKILIAADTAAGYLRATDYFFSRLKLSDSGVLSISGSIDETVTIETNEFLSALEQDYKIVSQSKSERVSSALDIFVKKINALTESGDIELADQAGDDAAKELIIRDTTARNSLKLSYYDYVIREIDNKIEVVATSPLAVVSALERFYQLIIWQDFDDQYVFNFSTENYNPIINDQSLFVPNWAGKITVPSWMTDFNEKLYALTDTDGRHMSVAHRGDVINYPEDSLEGILSAALLGADVIELDLQLTKDNIIVICHDNTLTKTTNVNELKGKNGLPSSTNISDWTYEQITQLSLIDRSGKLTEYKLPSLYEIFAVAKDRCFLMLDDKTGFTKDDILPMQLELDACEVSIYSMFVSSASGTAASNSFSTIKSFSKDHPELTKLAENVEKVTKYLAMPGHRIRSRGWLYGDATTDPYIENEERYIEAYNSGNTLLYTNNIPLFSQYLAKNYTASVIPS